MSTNNPPIEDPLKFFNLDFNSDFFTKEATFSPDLIKNYAITYPIAQNSLITFPNKIEATDIITTSLKTNAWKSQDGTCLLYTSPSPRDRS